MVLNSQAAVVSADKQEGLATDVIPGGLCRILHSGRTSASLARVDIPAAMAGGILTTELQLCAAQLYLWRWELEAVREELPCHERHQQRVRPLLTQASAQQYSSSLPS